MEIKSLDRPDETRPFAAKGQAAVVNIGGAAVLRGTFEPGWRWSEHVKPLAKTDSCQAAHAGYVLSGRMGIRMDDGTEGEVGPGDVFFCAAGPRRLDRWGRAVRSRGLWSERWSVRQAELSGSPA